MFTFLEEFEEMFAYFVGGECSIKHREWRIGWVDISILSVNSFGPFAAGRKTERECILRDTIVLCLR